MTEKKEKEFSNKLFSEFDNNFNLFPLKRNEDSLLLLNSSFNSSSSSSITSKKEFSHSSSSSSSPSSSPSSFSPSFEFPDSFNFPVEDILNDLNLTHLLGGGEIQTKRFITQILNGSYKIEKDFFDNLTNIEQFKQKIPFPNLRNEFSSIDDENLQLQRENQRLKEILLGYKNDLVDLVCYFILLLLLPFFLFLFLTLYLHPTCCQLCLLEYWREEI